MKNKLLQIWYDMRHQPVIANGGGNASAGDYSAFSARKLP